MVEREGRCIIDGDGVCSEEIERLWVCEFVSGGAGPAGEYEVIV